MELLRGAEVSGTASIDFSWGAMQGLWRLRWLRWLRWLWSTSGSEVADVRCGVRCTRSGAFDTCVTVVLSPFRGRGGRARARGVRVRGVSGIGHGGGCSARAFLKLVPAFFLLAHANRQMCVNDNAETLEGKIENK